MAFGTAKYIPIHEIAVSLGPQKSQALPIFHAYTGCDTVSSFSTRSKKSAWETWKVFDEVTATFLALSTGPVEVNNENVATLERFTILLYGRTSFTSRALHEERQTHGCYSPNQSCPCPAHQKGCVSRRTLLGQDVANNHVYAIC